MPYTKKEYKRPDVCDESSYSPQRKAWGVAHTLQCEVEDFLREVQAKETILSRSALKIMLKYWHRELHDLKENLREVMDE